MEPMEIDDGSALISYALANNCSREVYDLLFKTFADSVKISFFFIIIKIFIHVFQHDVIYDNIHQILRSGHRKLAASIIGDIKDNAFHGFNYLHHQVCFN
jgi:hypothetical protein